jgi:hypothetical protein
VEDALAEERRSRIEIQQKLANQVCEQIEALRAIGLLNAEQIKELCDREGYNQQISRTAATIVGQLEVISETECEGTSTSTKGHAFTFNETECEGTSTSNTFDLALSRLASLEERAEAQAHRLDQTVIEIKGYLEERFRSCLEIVNDLISEEMKAYRDEAATKIDGGSEKLLASNASLRTELNALSHRLSTQPMQVPASADAAKRDELRQQQLHAVQSQYEFLVDRVESQGQELDELRAKTQEGLMQQSLLVAADLKVARLSERVEDGIQKLEELRKQAAEKLEVTYRAVTSAVNANFPDSLPPTCRGPVMVVRSSPTPGAVRRASSYSIARSSSASPSSTRSVQRSASSGTFQASRSARTINLHEGARGRRTLSADMRQRRRFNEPSSAEDVVTIASLTARSFNLQNVAKEVPGSPTAALLKSRHPLQLSSTPLPTASLHAREIPRLSNSIPTSPERRTEPLRAPLTPEPASHLDHHISIEKLSVPPLAHEQPYERNGSPRMPHGDHIADVKSGLSDTPNSASTRKGSWSAWLNAQQREVPVGPESEPLSSASTCKGGANTARSTLGVRASRQNTRGGHSVVTPPAVGASKTSAGVAGGSQKSSHGSPPPVRPGSGLDRRSMPKW